MVSNLRTTRRRLRGESITRAIGRTLLVCSAVAAIVPAVLWLDGASDQARVLAGIGFALLGLWGVVRSR